MTTTSQPPHEPHPNHDRGLEFDLRKDITSSFGTSSTTADGVPLTVTLTLLDNANGCAPLAGAAVYAWHCDKDGKYSLYDAGLKNENYLRG
ncbi:MAG TPA: hypothetical protein VF885_00165, partial [Arthrobacter sp.]